MFKKYFINILIGFDRMCNAILLGNNDETISSRAGRWMKTSPVALQLCQFLYRLDKNHCKKSVDAYHNDTAINDNPIAGAVMFIVLLIVIGYLFN